MLLRHDTAPALLAYHVAVENGNACYLLTFARDPFHSGCFVLGSHWGPMNLKAQVLQFEGIFLHYFFCDFLPFSNFLFLETPISQMFEFLDRSNFLIFSLQFSIFVSFRSTTWDTFSITFPIILKGAL